MIKDEKLTPSMVTDAQKVLDLSNKYILEFTNMVSPKDYEKHLSLFVSLCLSGAALISAAIIETVSKTFEINTSDLTVDLIKKIGLSFELLRDRKEEKGTLQ